MRILAGLAILATALWCGYWFVGRTALDRAIVAGLAATPEVTVAGHSIAGFPNRFDVTFDEPRLTDGALTWRAPFVQVFALSYRLNHLLAVFAHDQQITAPGLDATIHSEDLRASLVMEAGLDLPLDRLTLVGQALDLDVNATHHQIDTLRAASRRSDAVRHELAIVLEGALPDPAEMDRLDPQRIWPRRFDLLRLDAEVEFDAALDRHVVQGQPPRVTRLTLTGAQVRYEATDITLTGRLTPNAEGLLSGDLTVTVAGFHDLMRRARDAGLMPPEHDALMTMALQGLVSPDDPDRIEAAFAVVDGEVRMGPILVGSLPPLR